MPPAPLPDDEAIRMETLRSHAILDTAPDRSFDCIVEMAAAHFGMPIALVSLVDEDRQWFKAKIGLDVEETPRDQAFCAHAILRPDDVLVVEDATEDARFADNPLVTGGPAIRFYAGAPIRAEDGQPMGTLCVIDQAPRKMDAAGRQFLANLAMNAGAMLELHRKNRTLAATSNRDSLTGLANRRAFDEALRAACAGLASGTGFALLALDLNGFKAVNDTYGHDAGDAVLREVARRMGQVVRGRDLVARTGGDEFMVIVNGPIDATGLARVAERVTAAFEADILHMGRRLAVRTSLGAALAPLHGDDPASVAKAADDALYAGKRRGTTGMTLAEPETEPTLEQELRAAIAEGALELHWQPYFRAGSGACDGFEALLRWTRANGKAVSPVDIVAMAEAGGFMMDLDRTVLRQACGEAAGWRVPLRVSVNISALSFSSADLVGQVAKALAETGLAPGRLTVELTESTLVRHTDRARERIAGLHALGARVAMDDFGTGFASLGYLSRFEFDVLKLDRTFVLGLGKDRRAEAVATAVLALGKALDMSVCAEGVETEEQMAFLRQGGCDTLQGFLLGRPKPRAQWDDMAERGVNEAVGAAA